MLTALVRRFVAVPEAVFQILLGVALGPSALNVVRVSSVVNALSTFGLAYLLFLAGLEIDVSRLRTGRPLRSGLGWVFSITVALLVSDVLQATNLLHHSVTAALCLSTTALGTLVPILRDGHVFATRLGTVTLTVGSIGEFGPIVIAAMLLSTASVVATGALTVGFIVLVVAAATLAGCVRPYRHLDFCAVTFTRRRSFQFDSRCSSLWRSSTWR